MNSEVKKYRILLTGGGTGGSVMPLLAVFDELKINLPTPLSKGGEGGLEFLWLGTKFGPEKQMVEKEGIKFKAISGGKWRRYFSFKNLADILKIKLGFFQALFIMLAWRPKLVMSAGSFISVPVVWAAWILNVPVLIHQQDILPGLANRLMAPFAEAITVTFEKSLADYGKKAIWIGNPVRRSLEFKREKLLVPRSFGEGGKVKSEFNLTEDLPVVLILGGGTGAMAINKLVEESLNELIRFCQVVHITGKDKSVKSLVNYKNYTPYEFLDADKMAEALEAADLVITRAGLGFLSELSYLKKPSIIIPLPDSHQEANAEYFKSRKAAMVVNQKYLAAASFSHMIKDLLADEKMLGRLATNIKQAMKPGAGPEMVRIIKSLLK